MSDLSLQDVMNTVARQLERCPPPRLSASRAAPTELEIFASYDPLLADLLRQYGQARFARRKQEECFGADDPMADVARDMEDSAWCAMQTRYMELRGDRDTMRAVQAKQAEIRDEERRAKERERDRRALESFYQADMMARMKKRAKTPVIYEWLIILWLLQRSGERFSIAPGFTRLAA